MNRPTRPLAAHDTAILDLNTWLIEAGLTGKPLLEMLTAYCEKLVGLGIPLYRTHITLTALHPNYGGLGFDWHHTDGPQRREYAHSNDGQDNWLSSPFFYMLSRGRSEYRERMIDADTPSQFPLLNDMAAQGATDYYTTATLFEDWPEGKPITVEDDVEGALVSWTANGPNGFTDADLSLIQQTFPTLCIVLKTISNQEMARDLLGVYLGKDAGQRVLSGKIQRGTTQWIDAVICYFDLEGFTSMSQRVQGEDLIATLNDYFGLVVGRIEGAGGNVLKFMGDGILAIFDREVLSDASDRAIDVTLQLEREMTAKSAARAADGLPVMGYTMAVHKGPVLYGNMGGEERLDFTVIGPEVNLAARISGMHKPLGQHIIISETVTDDAKSPHAELISLGRYMLRGVDRPQELFTLFSE